MPRAPRIPGKTEFRILSLIADYATRPQIEKAIQRTERVTGPRLSRILRALEENEQFIIKIPKSYPQAFELTGKGRQRLKELQFYVIHDDPPIPLNCKPLYSLDNYSVKYPVVSAPAIYAPTEAQLNGMVQKILSFKDCTVRVNGAKSLTIEVLAQFGEDPDRLLHRARSLTDTMAGILQDNYGMVLGVGEINKDFSLELATPETLALHKEIGFVRDYLDKSKLGGELVFSGRNPAEVANRAKSWVEAPGEISAIKQELMYIHENNTLLQNTVVQLLQEVNRLSTAVNGMAGALMPKPQPEAPRREADRAPGPGTGQEVA